MSADEPRAWPNFGDTRNALSIYQSILAMVLVSLSPNGACNGTALADLGQLLFFDPNLSSERTQSCATCHDPSAAFVDPRDNDVHRAASLGDDGRSIGDRNTPSAGYASHTPNFTRNLDGEYVGGLFLDGRAVSLEAQAVEPLFNPEEMALRDAATAKQRIMQNSRYVELLTQLYGIELFDDEQALIVALGKSFAAFQKTDVFSPFDSKYDRFLVGAYEMTPLEEIGRSLFFSPLTNCTSCHLTPSSSMPNQETFTNYRYNNIGLPVNDQLRNTNQKPVGFRDHGLLDNPSVRDVSLDGKFKVPSLRNVAVTGPYMHNGIFKQLSTAILFYNKYTVVSQQSQTNPETGAPWGEPEVPATIDFELLNEGQPIDQTRVQALVAFLETLTDRRYEALLK